MTTQTSEAQAALTETSTPALLRAAYALTHRIHERADLAAVVDLRAQRDLIDAEILRRTGDPAPIDANGKCRQAGHHVEQEPEHGGDHGYDYCPTRSL